MLHPEPSDDWDLKIDYVQPRDAGVYECQINTEPKINMAVMLNVEGEDPYALISNFHKNIYKKISHSYQIRRPT